MHDWCVSSYERGVIQFRAVEVVSQSVADIQTDIRNKEVAVNSLHRGIVFTVEAEQLVKANKALVNGGKVAVQPMAGFGPGWSGNAQLFWSGGAVGAVLDLLVDVPAAATYAVEL